MLIDSEHHRAAQKVAVTPRRLRFLYASLGFPKGDLARCTGWSMREIEEVLSKYKIQKWKGDIVALGQDEILALGVIFGNPELVHIDWGGRPGGGRASDLIREVRLTVEKRFKESTLDWPVVDALADLVRGIADAERRGRKRAQGSATRSGERKAPVN